MAHPVKWHPDIVFKKIFERIAGGEPMAAICRDEDMPSYPWVTAQIRAHTELQRQYTAALEDRADFLAWQIEMLADSPMPQGMDGASKSAWVQHLRVKLDARKWLAAKMAPKRYGEKLEIDNTVRVDLAEAMRLAQERVDRFRDGNVIENSTAEVVDQG